MSKILVRSSLPVMESNGMERQCAEDWCRRCLYGSEITVLGNCMCGISLLSEIDPKVSIRNGASRLFQRV